MPLMKFFTASQETLTRQEKIYYTAILNISHGKVRNPKKLATHKQGRIWDIQQQKASYLKAPLFKNLNAA